MLDIIDVQKFDMVHRGQKAFRMWTPGLGVYWALQRHQRHHRSSRTVDIDAEPAPRVGHCSVNNCLCDDERDPGTNL